MDETCVIYHTSDLGPIRIEANLNGIYKIDLLGPDEVKYTEPTDRQIDKLNCDESIKSNLKKCTDWMTAYFNGDFTNLQKNETIPILDKTDHSTFATKVWKCLDNVSPGQTISYGQVAQLVGSEGASRAVGQVMKHNRLSLILPCHRVIRADGSLGHYSSCGGTKTKEWLLEHEKNH